MNDYFISGYGDWWEGGEIGPVGLGKTEKKFQLQPLHKEASLTKAKSSLGLWLKT